MSESNAQEPYAAGDRIERLPPGGLLALRIDASYEQPGWRARTKGSQTRADHAGTAVLFEGAFYEVLALCKQGNGRYLYELAPWDGRFPMAAPKEYSKESCEHLAAAVRAQRREDGLALGSLLLSPLVSMLPAQDQLAIERRWQLHAAWNCCLWAAIFTGLSSLSIGVAVVHILSRRPSFFTAHIPLFLYYFLESLVRYAVSWSSSLPVGSLPVALPIETFRLVRRLASKEQRDRDAPRLRAQEIAFDTFDNAVDSVEPVDLGDGKPRLRVTSLLPKDHWTLFHSGIRYQDKLWIAVEREELQPERRPGRKDTDQLERHRFLLEPLGEGAMVASCLDYDPREVQHIHRERLRRRYEAWIYSLAMLWGALEWPLKQRLEAAFDFDALRSSKQNVVLLGIGGGGTALGQLAGIVQGSATLSHFVALFLGALLLWESILRWQQLKRGYDQGSLLGLPLAGVARVMLRVGARNADDSALEARAGAGSLR